MGWGHHAYGADNIKCNCKHGGWNKNPGYCLAEKMPSAPSSGEKLSLDDMANSDEEPADTDNSLDALANGDTSSDSPVEDERGSKKKKKDKKTKRRKIRNKKLSQMKTAIQLVKRPRRK